MNEQQISQIVRQVLTSHNSEHLSSNPPAQPDTAIKQSQSWQAGAAAPADTKLQTELSKIVQSVLDQTHAQAQHTGAVGYTSVAFSGATAPVQPSADAPAPACSTDSGAHAAPEAKHSCQCGGACKCARFSMTLALAKRLAARVEQEAARMGVRAVVAISNAAARPVLIECMDDSYIASYDVAVGKAYTVVALKMSTRELKGLVQPAGPLYGIQHMAGGKLVVFGGGVPLLSDGKVVGGLGVSGGTEAQDSALADYGAKVFAELMR